MKAKQILQNGEYLLTYESLSFKVSKISCSDITMLCAVCYCSSLKIS